MTLKDGPRDEGTRGHFLLVGNERDPLCALVSEELARGGHPWRHVASLADMRFSIRLGDGAPAVCVRFDDGLALADAEVRGVLMRDATGMHPEGWHPEDLSYAAAEARSALIACLWALACPIVNRPRPDLWQRGQSSAFAWRREVQRAGLAMKSHVVRCGEAVDIRRELPDRVRLMTATSPAIYDVGDDGAWERVARLAALVPVTLVPRHGDAAIACVVGGEAVWAVQPAPRFRACEPGLARLATATGLDVFEVTLVDVDGRACVESIEPWGGLAAFGEAACRDIAVRLVQVLTRPASGAVPAFEWRGHEESSS